MHLVESEGDLWGLVILGVLEWIIVMNQTTKFIKDVSFITNIAPNLHNTFRIVDHPESHQEGDGEQAADGQIDANLKGERTVLAVIEGVVGSVATISAFVHFV